MQAVKGPGAGNKSTNAFLGKIRERAVRDFGRTSANRESVVAFCKRSISFPSVATIVEVALDFPNPASEFETDVLKAIMAQENGYVVERSFL